MLFLFYFQCKHAIFEYVKLNYSQTKWTQNAAQTKLKNKNYNMSS